MSRHIVRKDSLLGDFLNAVFLKDPYREVVAPERPVEPPEAEQQNKQQLPADRRAREEFLAEAEDAVNAWTERIKSAGTQTEEPADNRSGEGEPGVDRPDLVERAGWVSNPPSNPREQIRILIALTNANDYRRQATLAMESMENIAEHLDADGMRDEAKDVRTRLFKVKRNFTLALNAMIEQATGVPLTAERRAAEEEEIRYPLSSVAAGNLYEHIDPVHPESRRRLTQASKDLLANLSPAERITLAHACLHDLAVLLLQDGRINEGQAVYFVSDILELDESIYSGSQSMEYLRAPQYRRQW